MNEHTGFHEYKNQKRFNPQCLKCLAEDRDFKQNEVITKLTLLKAGIKRRKR